MKGYGVKFSDGTSLTTASFLDSTIFGAGTVNQVALWSNSNNISGSPSLIFDSLNIRLGLGTASPLYALHILSTNAISFDLAAGGTLQIRGSNGTPTVPTAILSGNVFARVSLQGFDGLVWDTDHPAGVAAIASENWTITNHGSHLGFFSTTTGVSGPTVEQMRLTAQGFLGIGTSIPTAKLDVRGGSAFNQDNSGTADFQVGSAGTDTMLFVDASTNKVGIGTASPAQVLDIIGGLKSGSLATPNLLLVDDVNDRIGIGTATPAFRVHIVGGDTTVAAQNTNAADTNVAKVSVINDIGRDVSSTVYSSGSTGTVYGISKAALATLGTTSASPSPFVIGNFGTADLVFGTGSFGAGSEKMRIKHSPAAVIFNEGGLVQDFRVEGVGDPNVLFVDAASSRVGIGTNSPISALHVTGATGDILLYTISNSALSTAKILALESNNNGHAALFAENISPGNSNAKLSLEARGSGTARVENDSSTGRLVIQNNAIAGDIEINILSATGPRQIVINELGANVDFRVEGDTNQSLLFVDASADKVGIGTSFPIGRFQVEGGSSIFNLLNGANDFTVGSQSNDHMFFVQGSTNRVGINTSSPTATFNVEGAVHFNQDNSSIGDFRVGGNSGQDFLIFSQASTNRVGINTSVPTATFTVEGGSSHFNQNQIPTYDFRVGGRNTETILFVDASNTNSQPSVGINTATAPATLTVGGSFAFVPTAVSTATFNPTINVLDSSYIRITVSGSSGSAQMGAGRANGHILILEIIDVFSGSLAFTNNTGNLRLTTSNFTANANDTLTLIYSGAVWVEISRSVN